MKLEEIKNQYQGEWVLIEYTLLNDNLVPLEGEVLAHSKNRDKLCKYHY